MSDPLRFKPINPAYEMVYSPAGGYVKYEDYQKVALAGEAMSDVNSEVARLTNLVRKWQNLALESEQDVGRLKADYARLLVYCNQLEEDIKEGKQP